MTGAVNRKAMPKVGERAKLSRIVERFPHFWVAAGATGTITEASLQLIAMKMDEPIPGAEGNGTTSFAGQWTMQACIRARPPKGWRLHFMLMLNCSAATRRRPARSGRGRTPRRDAEPVGREAAPRLRRSPETPSAELLRVRPSPRASDLRQQARCRRLPPSSPSARQ